MPGLSDRDLVHRFRVALGCLALALAIGTAVELATLRHWKSPVQLVPWLVVLLVGCVSVLIVVRRTSASVWSARIVGALSALGAAFGVYEHIESNVETGALDARYTDTWASMSGLQHLWLAATGGVGASPPLAPGFLAVSGLCLLLATAWINEARDT